MGNPQRGVNAKRAQGAGERPNSPRSTLLVVSVDQEHWPRSSIQSKLLTPKMRTIVIADDDSLVGQFDGTAQLLISLGDIWDRTIEEAFARYECIKGFAVKGNHDSAGPLPEVVTSVHESTEEYGGLVFGGFGGSWKYKPRGHHLYEQNEVSRALENFPPVDVFVAHNSPSGIHERDSDVHQGFGAFLEYIERVQPRYFLHGHQHLRQTTVLGRTEIIGVFGEQLIELEIDQ